MENNNHNTANKHCHSCYYFSGYYTRGTSRFVRSDVGYCHRHNRIVENRHDCEKWIVGKRRFIVNKNHSLDFLFKMLDDISGIRQILQETEEELKADD